MAALIVGIALLIALVVVGIVAAYADRRRARSIAADPDRAGPNAKGLGRGRKR